jgi:chromosomal replication initiator protein
MSRVTGRSVLDFVSERFDVAPADIIGRDKSRPVVHMRMVAMLLIRELCPHLSYNLIGKMMGGRDHTTVMSNVVRAREIIQASPEMAEVAEATLVHFGAKPMTHQGMAWCFRKYAEAMQRGRAA